MSVKSLMINCVETQYTQEYIANVFWNQCIAKVSSITLMPYLKNEEIYNMAYIAIEEWCDSEAAYNFIQRLNDSSKEARIVYDEDNWWPVQINSHNNGNISVGPFTTTFMADYFVRTEDDVTAPCTEIEDEDFPVIQGLNNDFYTTCEASLRMRILRRIGSKEHATEIAHLENELRIHNAVQNSANVTQRNKMLSSEIAYNM
jgi:hypothetical protein